MAATKIICKEHLLHVGGCNCLGAKVVEVPCPHMEQHTKWLVNRGNTPLAK